MAKLYTLRLEAGFPAETRRRAGLVLRKGERLTAELTDEQLEAVQNDEWIRIKEAGEGEGESVSQDLSALKRKDLNLIATELGLDPSEYKNIETLVPAIEEARLAKQNSGTNTPPAGPATPNTDDGNGNPTTPPAPETTPPANPEDETTPPANPDTTTPPADENETNVPNLADKSVDELELIAADLSLGVTKVEDEAAYKAALIKAIEDAKPSEEE